MTIRFAKAHGLGNDFILVEARLAPAEPSAWARRLCDRHTGVGGDGVLLHSPAPDGVRMRLLNADGTMKSPDALRAEFESAGVDLKKPVITSCGSGITAAVLSLALERIGHRNHSLYDGSWTEWGSFPDLPIATGDA